MHELLYPQMRIGFGLVAPPRPHPQILCEGDNSKTNAQNVMKLCMSLDISM